jgi:hypothetical protein
MPLRIPASHHRLVAFTTPCGLCVCVLLGELLGPLQHAPSPRFAAVSSTVVRGTNILYTIRRQSISKVCIFPHHSGIDGSLQKACHCFTNLACFGYGIEPQAQVTEQTNTATCSYETKFPVAITQ